MLSLYSYVLYLFTGMSTGIAIEYLSKELALEASKPKGFTGTVRMNPSVIFCVLDTPFESVKLMIDSCLRRLKVSGYDLPDSVISLFGSFARRAIAGKLKGDLYAVEPIQQVKTISTPCMILVAEKDDYIPGTQCLHIAENW